MKIGSIKILVSPCVAGIYLRWWYNGWHYFNFTNGYDIEMNIEHSDSQTTRMFSVISKTERPTKIKAEYSYKITLSGITPENIPGFLGLLMAEKVEQYENSTWYDIEITRGDHLIKDAGTSFYILDFEITRKDRSMTATVYQKSQKLYIGDTLCDLDDDEVVPINKQVNDIAEMQDRQSDFTAQFKIRKTRLMRALFELSGEVGASTNYPYENKPCKLIQNGIELIREGNCILDKVDEQYYHVAIYSGNTSFFKKTDGLKIGDLTLASTIHTWSASVQADANENLYDYCYPMCEPSDDGGIIPLSDDGDRAEVYGGWIWPFIKIKAIWDEIFLNAGYMCQGEILTNEIFSKLFLPICTRTLLDIDVKPYLYSLRVRNHRVMTHNTYNALDGSGGEITIVLGTHLFWKLFCQYYCPWAGDYEFRVIILNPSGCPLHVYVYVGGVKKIELINDGSYPGAYSRSYRGIYAANAGDLVDFVATYNNGCTWYYIQVLGITKVSINYGSYVDSHLYLPSLTQTDFIKMVCNIFGLIPEANPVGRTILFWNYTLLCDNIPNARDWSAFLSEKDDEVEFKFGDYAQNNYLKFKESDDVVKNVGDGIIKIEDQTLPFEKTVVDCPVSTCDEVTVLTDVVVSRIDFNKYNEETTGYDQNTKIDPRIVFIDFCKESLTSPLYQKTFGFRTKLSGADPGNVCHDVVTPRKASSLEVAFNSTSGIYYSPLKRMLTKTNLRRCKFNLPSYEVAGLKHYIPIYLSQYRAYFYVNKINNYVKGKLCTIELIKL